MLRRVTVNGYLLCTHERELSNIEESNVLIIDQDEIFI